MTTIAANAGGLLGWRQVPSFGRCEGYYTEPNLNPMLRAVLPISQAPAKVNADDAYLPLHKTWVFTGHVRISQPNRLATANKGYVYPDKKNHRRNTATLVGNVHLREPAQLFVGHRAHLALNSAKGTLEDGVYRIGLHQKPTHNRAPVEHVVGLTAWGYAKKIIQVDKMHYHFQHSSYTTCSPTHHAWRLKSHTLQLNRVSGRGIAHDATLYVHGIPVFYTPYFNFPIDNRRQTGFLWPAFATTSQDGFVINLPYYLNLAPNYDATLTPHWMSKRGLQLNTTLRYLTAQHSGSLLMSYLPHDQAFRRFQQDIAAKQPNAPFAQRLLSQSDNRGALHWRDKSQFNANWRAESDVSWVSDDYYVQDLSGNLDLNSNQYASNQLEQSAFVEYSNLHWLFTTRVQAYQTLHLINTSPIYSAYNRLPEITVSASYPDSWHGLAFSLQGQYTHFEHPWVHEFSSTPPITGDRFNLEPGLSRPMQWASGYVTPSVQLMLTHYNLRHQPTGNPSEISRALPIVRVDTGLYFDRDTHIGHTDYTQTLEPRALFTYIPYRDQNNIPVFDSPPQTYYYNQVFNYNRFAGIDRIGDAKQVALGFTTRFIEHDTGTQRFLASVGEIFFAGNQLVSSCSTPGCINTHDNPPSGKTITASTVSAYAQYTITRDWNLSANYSWDPTARRINSANARLNFVRDQQHIVNFGYDFIYGYSPYPVINGQSGNAPSRNQNNLNNLSFSFVWPISTQKWLAIGSAERNISHGHLEDFLLGVEYNTCCWAVRLVGGKTFSDFSTTGQPRFSRAIYLQWQLKGLGEMGNTQLDFLQRNIPHYRGQFMGET